MQRRRRSSKHRTNWGGELNVNPRACCEQVKEARDHVSERSHLIHTLQRQKLPLDLEMQSKITAETLLCIAHSSPWQQQSSSSRALGV